MHTSLEVLVAGAVDYAGLFPPAALEMDAAVANYASYRDDPAGWMLGRFVVPVLRLPEFEELAASLLPTEPGSEPWRLSALVGPDVTADIALSLAFNGRHSAPHAAHAVIDVLEMRASTTPEIEGAMSRMPGEIAAYFELPLAQDPAPLVDALRRTGGRAKARTGGVTPDAFPAATHVARFLVRCRDARVECKFTAGLHHPVRGSYPLTYAPDAACGTMYGFLNAFVAGALAYAGADEAAIIGALDETDPSAFGFGDDALRYAGHTIDIDTLRAIRAHGVHAFGSCSFREPADELSTLSTS